MTASNLSLRRTASSVFVALTAALALRSVWYVTTAHLTPSHTTGHSVRTYIDILCKIIFYSELQQETHSFGGQRKRFKDCPEANLDKNQKT